MFLLLGLHLAFGFAKSAWARAPPIVEIPGLGAVEGVYSDEYPGIQRYFAIPFAEPPVGTLRWSNPRPHGPFATAPLDATRPGAACWQPDAVGQFNPSSLERPYLGNLTMSEDCLTLNVAVAVARERGEARVALPVMVWIHGGAYSVGAGGNYRNDALVHASGGAVIVVTINYRLGVLGFLGSAELASRGGDGSTGNYGMADQRMALRWVKNHIAAFGGDPGSITIFGESAGGNSVITHLVQPRSFPSLFKRAIIQSGTYAAAVSMADAERVYQTVLANTSCPDVGCLLGMDALAIAAAFPPGAVPGPVIDGVALLGNPYDLIQAGEYKKDVHVILGHNREENAWGICPPSQRATFQEVQLDEFLTMYGLNASSISRIKQLYSNGTFPYPLVRGNQSFWWWAAAASLSDIEFGLGHCTVRRVARMLVAGGSPDVYAYEFKHPAQGDATDGTYGWSLAGDGFSVPGNTVCPHGSEIVFAFGAAHSVPPGEAAALASRMGELWSNFAAAGTPGKVWPSYAQSNDTFLLLDVGSSGGIRPEQRAESEQCAFFDSLADSRSLLEPLPQP